SVVCAFRRMAPTSVRSAARSRGRFRPARGSPPRAGSRRSGLALRRVSGHSRKHLLPIPFVPATEPGAALLALSGVAHDLLCVPPLVLQLARRTPTRHPWPDASSHEFVAYAAPDVIDGPFGHATISCLVWS